MAFILPKTSRSFAKLARASIVASSTLSVPYRSLRPHADACIMLIRAGEIASLALRS